MNKSLRYCAVFIFALCQMAKGDTSPAVDFEKEVRPILEEKCWHCHGEDEQESALRLDRRANMLVGGDHGLASIVPGKPEKSYLIDLIKHKEADLEMPPDDDQLSQKEIETLERWIAEGAVWPGQMQTVERAKSDHWSFQPITRPEVPLADGENGKVANPIDQFLLSRLKKDQLEYSSEASPRKLLRRLSIVLTGLPPTREETAQYLKDYEANGDAAYATAVERLLASPHFGERWAQHWLDVIRWAETNGSESNMYRKNAWLYRDYVVRAFNEDKPYKKFLFEQIAGDTVGEGEALGYLVAGPHVPVATVGQEPSARRQARADRMDEILQTVGASALGLTVGCARCHNHKFDPISISDYYSMSAVFQDIEFGSRIPELKSDHPLQMRGDALLGEIEESRRQLSEFGPWEEHWTAYREIHFRQPVRTSRVRISFLNKQAWVDELEIFGPDESGVNYAIASSGTKAYCPPQFHQPRRELYKINDGMYGTEQWNGVAPKGSKEKPWVEFTFPEPKRIDLIRASSNREDYFETDYLEKLNNGNFSPYRIEVENGQGEWIQVAATPEYQKLSKQSKARAAAMNRLRSLIKQLQADGPKPGFVGRFVPVTKTFVFGRGSPENPRDEVFAAGPVELDGNLDLSPEADGRTRRAAFANWVASRENPLTARVAANRIWHHVFGRGIVSTPSDFGEAGAPPTHPELLDWLASELVDPTVGETAESKTWSMKHIIRMLVMSRAFRQSSVPRAAGVAVDADSALLWRYPPKRAEAEVIRDSILQAAGVLDTKIGGQSYRIHNVKKRYAQWVVTDNHGPHTWRRMIYQERMRRVDDQMFTQFDFPDCGQVRAKRPVSTTPLQALNLMNSRFVVEQSQKVAQRAKKNSASNAEALNLVFEYLLGRPPSQKEMAACKPLADAELPTVCRALMNSNEFAFIP